MLSACMTSRVQRLLLGIVAGMTLALFGSGVVQAQPADYQMSWFSVDGGGGVSEGGGYTLRSAIGQADAGSSTAGGYTLSGGFLVGGSTPAQPVPDGHSLFLPQLRRAP